MVFMTSYGKVFETSYGKVFKTSYFKVFMTSMFTTSYIPMTYVLPSLDCLVTVTHCPLGVCRVGEKNHVDVISQLRHGGEDEDQCGEDNHGHRGEGVELKIVYIVYFT